MSNWPCSVAWVLTCSCKDSNCFGALPKRDIIFLFLCIVEETKGRYSHHKNSPGELDKNSNKKSPVVTKSYSLRPVRPISLSSVEMLENVLVSLYAHTCTYNHTYSTCIWQ